MNLEMNFITRTFSKRNILCIKETVCARYKILNAPQEEFMYISLHNYKNQ